MRLCLEEFNQKLDIITSYIEALENEKYFIEKSKRITTECTDQTACCYYEFSKKITSINKRIINYNAIIISLYSAFEHFIESIAIAYLKKLNKIIKDYNKMPEKIRQNHIIYSSELILELNKSKYSGLNEKDIIFNLHNCMQNGINYKMNYEAFIKHNSNLRPLTINEIFSRINIENICSKIRENSLFMEYYSCKKEIDKNDVKKIISKIELNQLFSTINDLIEIRNQVAHSWVDETIDFKILKEDYIEFIKVFCNSIYQVLEQELCKYEVKYCSKKINHVKAIYNNEILCFNSGNLKIEKGDKIIIKKGNDKLCYGFIESIQIDGKEVSRVTDIELVDVGVKLSTKIKDNYEFFILLPT